MKRISTITLLIILFVNINSYSQIDKEIKSFVDTNLQIINNGKKLLLKYIIKENKPKALKIYNYLIEFTKDKDYNSFYYVEDIYVNLLLNNWSTLQSKMIQLKRDFKFEIYPDTKSIVRQLHNNIKKNSHLLKREIKNSQIKEDSKEALDILLYVIQNENLNEDYNKKINHFFNNYPNTNLKNFVKYFLPRKRKKTSLGITIQGGFNAPVGKFNDQFSSDLLLNFDISFNMNKIYTALSSYSSKNKLKQGVTTSNYIFNKNEEFEYQRVGIKCGYFLNRNKNTLLAPYVFIGTSSLESDRFDNNEDKEEYEIFNDFTYGLGVHSELLLWRFDYNELIKKNVQFFSLTFDAGYNLTTSGLGNHYFVTLGLNWSIGDF